MTFGRDGEAQLNAWMGAHAFVVWNACPDAWDLEHELLRQLDLPLNLDANAHGSFHAGLTEMRSKAKERARRLPPIFEPLRARGRRQPLTETQTD